MASGIGVHDELLVRGGVACRLQEPSANGHRVLVGGGEIVDPEVEVELLLRAAWPLGGCVVRGTLDTEGPDTVDDDVVPVLLTVVNRAAEQAGPAPVTRYVGRGGVS